MMLRIAVFILMVCVCGQACQKSSLDPLEGFVECSMENERFFEPSQKSFIPRSNSGFLDTACFSKDLLMGSLAFPNLDATKVCLLEQHLGAVKPYLSEALCGMEISDDFLDTYKYQYFNFVRDGEPYILVNAFTLPDSSEVDWKREPYIQECNDGSDHWTILFNLKTLEFEQFFYYLPYSVSILEEFPYGKLCRRCFKYQELKPFKVDKRDICTIERRITEIKNIIVKDCEYVGEQIDTSFEYHHQFMGVEQDGEQWIYVNAFILFGDLQNRLEIQEFAHDEFAHHCRSDLIGPSWGIFFNIDTEEFSDLQFSNL